MKWFKKHSTSEVVDKAAQGIAGSILKMQKAFASSMEKFSAKWQRKHQLIFLAVVSVVFIVFSLRALVVPFSGETKITNPGGIRKPATVSTDVEPRITKEEFERIQAFKKSLDSNTIKDRPGLMDSIQMVEALYYSNLK